MSKIIKYIKRGIHYILHGQPIVNVSPNIVIMVPNELLLGRTALITGGTRGIGKAIAESFLNAGADVIITSRTQTNVELVVAELKNKYPNRMIYGVEMDITEVDSIGKKVNEIIQMVAPHHIDILVNNAGISGGVMGHTTPSEFSKIIDTNLQGVFFLSEYVTKYMRDYQVSGNILMIASSSSLRPAVSAYHITKWGIRGFVLGLAKVCAPYGIVVNGIAPGPTATDMLGKSDNSDIYRETSPIGRYATPEEIANMAVILCSNMSRTIVGDIVYMTGGAGVITFDDVKYNL